MKLIRTLLPLSLLAVCGFAQDVHYNYDRNADFAKYRTYKWVEVPGVTPLNQLIDRQLKDAIEAELSKKGLVRATGDNSDLLVSYQAAVNKEQQFNAFTAGGPGWGYGPGWGRGWGYGSFSTTVQSTTIHVGAVGFDMYDAAKQTLVWRGEATKTIDTNAKPDKRQKNIEKGAAKLLKNYPPPVKK